MKILKQKLLYTGILTGSLMLAGCGADVSVEDSENTGSSLTQDAPFAYVSRSLNDNSATGLAYQGGAKLLVRERVSSAASDEEILANAIGTSDYDVRDLNVSPDGKNMVFSARTADSSWNIYQYNFAAGTVTRLIEDDNTAEAGHDTSPVYTVDGDIVFASTRPHGGDESFCCEQSGRFWFCLGYIGCLRSVRIYPV